MDEITDISNPAKTIRYWVEQYSDSMYSWAFYKTASKETAEDLVQDTFLAAFQSIEKFEGRSNPKTWLLAILNNKIADYHHKKFSRPTISEQRQSENTAYSLFDILFDNYGTGDWIKSQRPHDWPGEPENLLDDAAFNKVLQLCMERLPAQWFSAVQLKYLEEKKGELICQELQIAPTNFWQILHRAKLQLKKCLENNWFKK